MGFDSRALVVLGLVACTEPPPPPIGTARLEQKSAHAVCDGIQKLSGTVDDRFGRAIAIDGDTAIIGAPALISGEAAHVYRHDGSSWAFEALLTTGDTPVFTTNLGAAVALRGDVAIIADPEWGSGSTNAGGFYVFGRTGTTWAETQQRVVGDNTSFLGRSVSFDAGVLAVGVPSYDYGSVRIYRLEPDDSVVLEALVGSGVLDDAYGTVVAVSDDTIAVSAPIQGMGMGSVYVYRRMGLSWVLEDQLSGGASGSAFGRAMALDGDVLMVGAPLDDIAGDSAGAVYIYEREGHSWFGPTAFTTADADSIDFFGTSIALQGDWALVGAVHDDEGPTDAGGVYVLHRVGGHWLEHGTLAASDLDADAGFGAAVAIDNGRALVGATEDSIGGALAPADAVYAFDIGVLEMGAACDCDAPCVSGFCVDGVCCDSACGGGAQDCQACSVSAGATSDGTCQPVIAGTECRASAGTCDQAEVCNGADLACPDDRAAQDGTSCDDGDTCTEADVCEAGSCVAGHDMCEAPAGTGGAGSGGSGDGGDAGPPSDTSDGDCSCRQVGQRHSSTGASIALLLLALCAWRRRERLALVAIVMSTSACTEREPPSEQAALPHRVDVIADDVAVTGRMAVSATPGGAAASNATQGFDVTIDAGGAHLVTRQHQEKVSLTLDAIARGPVTEPLTARLDGVAAGRASLEYEHGVSGWVGNGPLGMSLGWSLADRFGGAGGPLSLHLRIGGDLRARAMGEGVALTDRAGAERLFVTDLYAWDADRRPLPARMTAEDDHITLGIDDRGARYPIVVDPLVWGQQFKLVGAGAVLGADFGEAVALSGNTAAVGAPGARRAYVFVRSGVSWTEEASLQPQDLDFSQNFGSAVALSGDTAAFVAPTSGTSGPVYVYDRVGTTWSQSQELVTSASTLSMDGDRLAIGQPSGAGFVQIWLRTTGTWALEDTVTASDAAAGDAFGYAVALDGDSLAVGARFGDGSQANTGTAYVFTRSGSVWTEEARLFAASGQTSDTFGAAIDIDADTLAVGSPGRGRVHVFTRSATVWSFEQTIDPSISSTGSSVGVEGDMLAIGAPGDDQFANNAGSVHLYARNTGVWSLATSLGALDASPLAALGTAMAVEGNTVLAGAPNATGSNAGDAYLFAYALSPGDTCTLDTDCASGFCADGLCCDRPCEGSCESCATGTCTFFAAATECRGSLGDCDPAEACDGSHGDCPPDQLAPAGTECRGLGGDCDLAEQCDGATATCPADRLRPAGSVCRLAIGACDADDSCDGASASCPADAPTADGTPCSDGDACTLADTCLAGQCTAGEPVCEGPTSGTGGAGAGGTGGASPAPPSSEDGGCGCRVASPASSGHAPALWWLFAIGVALRRSRPRREQSMFATNA